MARQKRIQIPGGIYHVITRGINRAAIFKDNADRCEFLRRLEEVLSVTHCQCFAWALLGNHLHLLIQTNDHSLSDLMGKLLTGYAIYFNRKHKRHGYLFQNRFKSILCQKEVYLLELVRYIHLNPVRAGLIETMSDLDNYPWTGHAVMAGKRKADWQATDEILAHFGNDRREGMAAYRQYLVDGWKMGKRERLTGGGLRRSDDGWRKVLEGNKNKGFWRGEDQILGDRDFVNDAITKAEEALVRREKQKQNGWTLERLAEKICLILDVNLLELRKKGRRNKVSQAKGLIAFWGKTEIGQTGAAIARFLGISRSGFHRNYCFGEKYAEKKGLKWDV